MATAVQREFAKKIRQYRRRTGESLQQAAAAVGISKAHLWEMEKGRSANPSLLLLVALAEHYQTSVAFLVGER